MVQAPLPMSDPRVCRGSIVAQKREEAVKQIKNDRQNREKERYHTLLIRNRLACIVSDKNSNRVHENNKIMFQRQIIPLRTYEETNGLNVKKNIRNQLARLAGSLQRRQEAKRNLNNSNSFFTINLIICYHLLLN